MQRRYTSLLIQGEEWGILYIFILKFLTNSVIAPISHSSLIDSKLKSMHRNWEKVVKKNSQNEKQNKSSDGLAISGGFFFCGFPKLFFISNKEFEPANFRTVGRCNFFFKYNYWNYLKNIFEKKHIFIRFFNDLPESLVYETNPFFDQCLSTK